ncbi:hypothetical protein FRC01_004678 [Tulasnella sp. 417]|nr:hypothetical protein FRC01_004678 [Tulasnella sp. 417]
MTDDAALATQVSSSDADSLINHLPTELLTWILQFAVLLGPRTSLHSEIVHHWSGLEYYEELSLIRRVCKKWQTVVETNPSFWIYISTYLPSRRFNKIAECAPRGRSLFVEYSPSLWFGREERLRTYVPVILRLSESWRSVHIQFANPSELLQVLKQPSPHLRKLHVTRCATAGTFEGLEEGCRTVSSPLEILEVKGSIFPWKWSAISDLRELDVECEHSCPYFRQGFIDVLRSSPRLESLGLLSCRTNFQPELQSSTISLPHLASINIKYSPLSSGLLAAITCPTSTKMTIWDPTQSLTTQNPWVAAAFNHTNFECTDILSVQLRPSAVVGAVIGNIDLEMRPLDRPFQHTAMTQFFTDLLKPFSESNGAQVTTLELQLDLEWDAVPLINILDSFFPNIASLAVRCFFSSFNSFSLFYALANPFQENGEYRWLLPRIAKLEFDSNSRQGRLGECILEIARSRYSSQAIAWTTEAGISSPPPTSLGELRIRNCAMLTNEAEELKIILGDAVKFEDVRFQNTVDEPSTQATN